MLYTEKEKNEIERVRKVFEKHIQQMTAYDLFGRTRSAMCGWQYLSTRSILIPATG